MRSKSERLPSSNVKCVSLFCHKFEVIELGQVYSMVIYLEQIYSTGTWYASTTVLYGSVLDRKNLKSSTTFNLFQFLTLNGLRR
jgi:hypothetical protein